jgi:DNA modification methylase
MDLQSLYCGDNLEVLRSHVKDDTIDLIYLDPPFNSGRNYGDFNDAWHWDQSAAASYQETVERGGKVSQAMQAFCTFLGESGELAYLAMMAPRLVELRRVLKPTGSIYLHCDPTASHYLKLLMDAVFGVVNFKNEIVWQRTNGHNDARGFGRIHDVILFYACKGFTWNVLRTKYSPEQLKRYKKDENGRLFTGGNLTAPSHGRESGRFTWRGSTPALSAMWGNKIERLEQWWSDGRILTKRDGTPRKDGLKQYLDEMPGKPLQSIWADIPRIANTASERLGYPTQKPEALLERIIKASSNECDVFLDPFCGCGTGIVVAQRLNRSWVGIDTSERAVHIAAGRIDSLMRREA